MTRISCDQENVLVLVDEYDRMDPNRYANNRIARPLCPSLLLTPLPAICDGRESGQSLQNNGSLAVFLSVPVLRHSSLDWGYAYGRLAFRDDEIEAIETDGVDTIEQANDVVGDGGSCVTCDRDEIRGACVLTNEGAALP